MPELESRRLGQTGIEAKALGLGCAWFGSDKSSDQDTIEGVRRAIELGLDFVDTSPHYGESERRVGLALEGGFRDKVHLQTKIGTHPDRSGDYSAEATRWSVENSLKLLKTDYLDSCLIHDPSDIELPLAPGHALDELLKMKEEAIVGHIGLGVRPHEFHRRAIETGKIEIVLTYLDYTLLNQSVAQTTLPLAREHGVGIILASILGMGSLAGPEPDAGKQPKAHAMWKWCNARDLSIRNLALQFVMAATTDCLVMFGPANRREVDEGYQAATTEVPPEIWKEFKEEFGVAAV